MRSSCRGTSDYPRDKPLWSFYLVTAEEELENKVPKGYSTGSQML